MLHLPSVHSSAPAPSTSLPLTFITESLLPHQALTSPIPLTTTLPYLLAVC